MAVMCLTAEYITINASDLKTYVKKAELTVEVDDLETTNFASAGWKEVIGGLKSGTLAITANDDFALRRTDSIIWPLLGTVVLFEVRPTQGAASTSNPKFTGSVMINSTTAGGDVGSLAEKDFSFPTSGAVTRATS